MSNGVPILGTVTKKCKVERISDYVFKIILVQGLNRQIRRMCYFLGYEVTKLQRVRIMNVSLGNLKVGDWRELTNSELDKINAMVASSSKTEEASKEKPKQKENQKSAKKRFVPKNKFSKQKGQKQYQKRKPKKRK